MTEVQSWVLIGVFTTIMLGSFAALGGYFRFSLVEVSRSLDLAKDALTAEIAASKAELKAELTTTKSQLAAKIDTLDRDVQALTRRDFGDDRA